MIAVIITTAVLVSFGLGVAATLLYQAHARVISRPRPPLAWDSMPPPDRPWRTPGERERALWLMIHCHTDTTPEEQP